MKRMFILLTLWFIFGQVNFLYALDYKRLHEEADNKNLRGAALAV